MDNILTRKLWLQNNNNNNTTASTKSIARQW